MLGQVATGEDGLAPVSGMGRERFKILQGGQGKPLCLPWSLVTVEGMVQAVDGLAQRFGQPVRVVFEEGIQLDEMGPFGLYIGLPEQWLASELGAATAAATSAGTSAWASRSSDPTRSCRLRRKRIACLGFRRRRV